MHLQELLVCQKTILKASIQEINVISQELIDRLNLRKFRLEYLPIEFEYSTNSKTVHLLHERKHAGAEGEHPPFPLLEFGVGRLLAPQGRLDMLGPGVGEDTLEVLQLEEVPEDELVPQDRLPGDDEREREFDSVVESERFVSCE